MDQFRIDRRDGLPGSTESPAIRVRIAVPMSLQQPNRTQPVSYRTNLLLFILTFLTTLIFGAYYQIDFMMSRPIALGVFEFLGRLFAHPLYLLYGLPFSFTLLIILLSHEMGHYLACRYYGIVATLPFFIPGPISPVGTFGAFIKIKSPITNKKALFDIGIAGPLAGFIMAVPAMAIGLAASHICEPSRIPAPGSEVDVMGVPLVYKILVLFFPQFNHDIIAFHPIWFASWFGLLATALNLFPIGQLDGGHILYAVVGRRFRWLTRIFWACTIFLGVLVSSHWLAWSLLTLILGLDHPPTWDERDPIGRGRLILFFVAILIFVLSFMPAPISRQVFQTFR